MAGLNFDFTGNPTSLVNAAAQSRAAIEGLTKEAENAGVSVDKFLGATKGFVTSLTGLGVGVAGLKSFASNLVNVRSEFQDTEARLKVFLKSEEAAANMMEELEDLAWNNTFEFSDITKASAQLLAFGTDAKDVGDTITRLSEIASGTGGSLNDLVEKFNKVKATGKMDSQIVQSFANMGVDVKSVLAEMEGKNRSDYDGMTLSFEQLQQVIRKLTDEGGMFFGMMKERGKNISDSIAGVKDNIALLFNEIGKNIQGPIKSSIDKANEGIEWMMDNWQGVANAIGACIVAAGSYKAALVTIEGIKKGQQKINFLLEKNQLVEVTKATEDQYIAEIEALEKEVIAGTAAKNADLELAVAKKQLTQEQADEIAKLRDTAQAQVEVLAAKSAAAQQEASIAANEFSIAKQREQNAQNAVNYWQEEVSSIDEKISALDSETAQEQISALTKKKSTAIENLETASKNLNTATTQRQSAAERVETTSKTAEATAARADAASQAYDTIGKKVNEKQTNALAKAQIFLKGVMQATGLSALANPYVLAAVAVAALCVGIYKLCTAEKANAKAAREYNDLLEKRKSYLKMGTEQVNNARDVITNDNTTAYQKQVEWDRMKNGTITKDDEGKDLNAEEKRAANYKGMRMVEYYANDMKAFASATEDEIERLSNQFDDDFNFMKAGEDIENFKAKIESLNEQILEASKSQNSGGVIFALTRQLKEANEGLKVAEQNLKDIKARQAEIAEQNKSPEQKLADIENKKTALLAQIEELKGKINDPMMKGIFGPDLFDPVTGKTITGVERRIESLKDQVEDLDNQSITINTQLNEREENKADTKNTIDQILKLEKELDSARVDFANNATEDNKKNLEKVESNLNMYINRYKLQTGKAWADTKKMEEERIANIRKLSNEEIRIRNGAIDDQRLKRKAEYAQTIKELQQEEAEYKRTHNGRSSGTLAQKKKNEKIQYELDLKNLDKQWNDWKANHKREIIHLEADIKMQNLQNQLDNAMTVAEKRAARAAIRAEEDVQRVNTNRESADDEILSKLGGDRAKLDKYKNAGEGADLASILGISPETVNELQQIEEHYANLLDLQNQQAAITRGQEDYQDSLSNYTAYCDEMIELAKWRQEQLNGIETGEVKDVSAADIERVYANQVEDRKKEYDISEEEGDIAQIGSNLASSLVDVTLPQLEAIAKKFKNEIDEKLQSERQALTTVTQNMQTEQASIDSNQSILEDETATDEQKQAASIAIEESQKRINVLKAEELSINQDIARLNTSRKAGVEQLQQAEQKATQISTKSAKKSESSWDNASEAIALANNACNTLANSLGKTLSKNGKKAIGVVSGVTQFATQNISSIKLLVQVTSKAMEASAGGAAASIKAAEKASVILTIISLAVQAIQTIVSLVSQFSTSAKMQEQIDADIKAVDRLKEKNEELQRAYESKSGTEYYKGMATAAKQYNEVIAAQEKAVRDAQAKADYEANKHGEDSGKAEDAAEQAKEQKQALADLKEEQRQMYEEMAQELLTTDLGSFASDLADTMVDSFSQGIGGIEDAWENTLDDLMKSMMKKGLAIAFENLFSGVWDNMKSMTEDGELTQSEMDSIMAEMEAKSAEAKQIAETYYNAMEERGLLDDEDVEGSSGGFASMTQDQADELSARFTALQIEGANVVTAAQAMQLTLTQLGVNDALKVNIITQILQQNTLATEIAQNQLDELRNIVINTSTLADTNKRLKAIEQNTNGLV